MNTTKVKSQRGLNGLLSIGGLLLAIAWATPGCGGAEKQPTSQGPDIADPSSLPCLDYWKVDNNTQETPLCAALHDPEFLLARTGPGLSAADWIQRFDYVWTIVDEIYAAFDSTDVDWDEVRTKYWDRTRNAVSSYEQVATLSRMLVELGDSHTGYFDNAVCAAWDTILATKSFSFYPVEIDGQLYVYASDDSRVQAGERIVSINGLQAEDLHTYWRERLVCTTGFSSVSAEQAMFLSTVIALATDPLFLGTEYESRLGVTLEDLEGQQHVLTPQAATDEFLPWDPGVLSYYAPTAPIHLEWEPYEAGYADLGGTYTSYLGHAKYENFGIMLFYDFSGWVDIERAMRHVIGLYPDVSGWVIDIRANGGGGPHEETLASFFIDEPIFYPCIQIREGDTYVPYDECPRPIVPDAAIHIEQPVAVLTSGLSVSAADFFAYLMAQAPRAQLFGQPTNGAFGGITINDPPDGSYSLIITGTRISDAEGHPLQGKSVDPDVSVNLTLPDIIAGEDTAMNAGLAWLSSFAQ